MNKLNSLIILITTLLISACANKNKIDSGVSHELAQIRSSLVSDIHYDLKIDVPDELSQPVVGECILHFNLTHAKDLPVDYTGLQDNSTLNIKINGEQLETVIQSEHIILPKKYLRKGENEVWIPFVSSDKTLNRHDDYLYSLFVPANARSVFPCFDQPDLKATFSLDLNVPTDWKTMQSASNKPIPTYLFSFVAGEFLSRTEQRSGRQITALYRESDPSKVEQLTEVFDMTDLAIRWMENYTNVPYPFDYYNIIILPGYQFGGMEHPGAIQFNDRRIFLPQNATPSEQLSRFDLIAHETAHMWFGDLVTMRWFDDVWTKEVFAGFFSDKMSREQFPDINHDLNHILSHFPAAFATDRTLGTHPIHQELDNLNSAGLLYGNIIYHKAPIMMRKIEQRMGEESMQVALQEYLNTFAYGNATWDELIAIMDRTAPEADMKAFDRKWVKSAGIPEADGDEKLEDMPYTVLAIENLPTLDTLINEYYDNSSINELRRMMFAINLFEHYKKADISSEDAFSAFKQMIDKEQNPLIANQLAKYIYSIYSRMPLDREVEIEQILLKTAMQHPLLPVRLQLKKSLYTSAISPTVLKIVESVWNDQSDKQLSSRNYTSIAYHLSLMNPDRWEEILDIQRKRLKTEDEIREFDYISKACNPDATARLKLFESILQPENRINEPWAISAISLLCDKTREQESCYYITPALDNLQYIQQSSDIFFPGNFLSALLSAKQSDQACQIIKAWIAEHSDYPISLMRKIKESGDDLIK